MEENNWTPRTFEFTVPSGYTYSIREQNGADEDILSNPMDVKTLMNLTKFIQAIVVRTDFTPSGRLTLEDVDRIPLNDRYCIIFNSRIFSLGEEVEFEYDWGTNGGKVSYAQDLHEFLFDYATVPSEKEFDEKPNAIPFYPNPKQTEGYEFTLSSGKGIMFDLLNGAGERMMVTIPIEKQTRNSALLARNLRLSVDGNFERVQNFSLFTPRDMVEIRKLVLEFDPIFEGTTEIQNPTTGQVENYPIMLAQSFFFLTEA